jgi:hypothetical protein
MRAAERALARLKRSVVLAAVLPILVQTGSAIELRPETVDAFDHFIATAEARLEKHGRGRQFLWSDDSPGMRQQLLSGTVVAQPLQGNGVVALKGGLIQDWRGAVFIPHTSLREVLSVVQDYDHHRDFYRPDVVSAKIEARQGDEFVVSMRILKAKFMLTDVLDTENAIRFVEVDPKRVYSRSYSRRINEVASAGQASEHQLPSGADRGLLWRLFGYWFFEERDDGVYVTCESITLTRDIPFGMGGLLSPILHDLPSEALRKTLEQTRRAVVALH